MREWELELGVPRERVAAAISRAHDHAVWLDGRGGFADAWGTGFLVALGPRIAIEARGGQGPRTEIALRSLERLLHRRRERGGSAHTGVALLLGYEAFDPVAAPTQGGADAPAIIAFEVEESLRPVAMDRWVLEASGDGHSGSGYVAELQRLVEAADSPPAPRPARVYGRVTRSFSREAYLGAVQRIRERIHAGDLYQANLCQRFSSQYRGDPLDFYHDLVRATPAPRSAFVSTPRLSVASASPEIFLRGDRDGRVETWPIKGTRPRHDEAVRDRAAARELESSEKDRAELMMIVDLERNDLGRVCRTGSIEVPALARLRSYAAVHHLVACVRGRLRADAGWGEILRATFPGGSISGAPKIRARDVLREIEPTPRSYFTGSLCWFGDDGSFDSSILIRTIVFAGDRVFLGAGGGIVADSDPEQEWLESLVKARAPARALGFEPEELA